MTAPDNFEVLWQMAVRDKDIRLAPLDNIIALDKKKGRCIVTIGVDEATLMDLLANKMVGGFIAADKKQFDALKKELSE